MTYKNIEHLNKNYGKQNHYTRHNQDLSLPDHKTDKYSKSQYYMGIKLFNKLPVNIKHAKDRNSFKVMLRKVLVEQCLYSVEEFLETTIS